MKGHFVSATDFIIGHGIIIIYCTVIAQFINHANLPKLVREIPKHNIQNKITTYHV